MTLRFIGEQPEEGARSISDALSADLGVEPFDVEWARVRTFPGGRRVDRA